MDFTKAVEFVRKAGGREEVERLECILKGKEPKAYFIKRLRELQNADGGFPFNLEKGKPSTLMKSAAVLARLEEFNSMQTDVTKKIINFFFTKQGEDGSWNEDKEILQYNPPPWINPRDIRAKVLSTAHTGFWLAKLGYSKDGRIKRACDFLMNYRKENGSFEGFRHTTWIAISLFALVYGKKCSITREGLKFLVKIPKDQWVSSQIAWLLWCLSSAGFTKNQRFIKHFLDLLLENQRSNGSFVSEDGKEFSVSTTIEVIKVVKCLGLNY